MNITEFPWRAVSIVSISFLSIYEEMQHANNWATGAKRQFH